MTSILKADNIQDADGNNIINENSNTITVGASGDTFALASGVTQTIAVNTPAFKVKNSSNISLSNGTNTKLTFDTEVIDSDGAFASDKFTVPSGKAGKYFISVQTSLQGSNDIRVMRAYVYKNGSLQYDLQTRLAFSGNTLDAGSSVPFSANGILDLSASDYLEVYTYIYNTAGGTYQAMSNECIFQGYKLIGV